MDLFEFCKFAVSKKWKILKKIEYNFHEKGQFIFEYIEKEWFRDFDHILILFHFNELQMITIQENSLKEKHKV